MAINENIRREIAEFNEGSMVFDNPAFDNSIIGMTTDDQVVYDYDKMVEEMMLDDNISQEEAADWIQFNSSRSIHYAGKLAPIIMFRFMEDAYGN